MGLASGSCQSRVHRLGGASASAGAGTGSRWREARDPITKRYRYAFDSAATLEEAERKRDELIERLAEGREPAEKATVSMLLYRWMDVADLALSTRVTHECYIERVIRPVLGDWPVRTLERRDRCCANWPRSAGFASGVLGAVRYL
jgi:hypothetical protein